MLIKAKALKGYSLKGLDGDIGSASEFFFDDRYWAVRYLVANTANWLSGREGADLAVLTGRCQYC